MSGMHFKPDQLTSAQALNPRRSEDFSPVDLGFFFCPIPEAMPGYQAYSD